MKIITTILTAAVLSTNVAFADDAPNANWVGPYAGFNMGSTAAHANLAFVGNGWWSSGGASDGGLSPSGPILGVQAGYNFAVGTDLLSSVEISYSPDQVAETIVSPPWPAFDTWTVGVENVLTLSGRFGKVVDNRFMYVTSGLTSAKITSHIEPPNDRSSATHLGFMIGAGMEFEVNDRATFGVEYKFSDFGPGFHPANAACGPCSTSDDRNISVSAHTVSARINVRF